MKARRGFEPSTLGAASGDEDRYTTTPHRVQQHTTMGLVTGSVATEQRVWFSNDKSALCQMATLNYWGQIKSLGKSFFRVLIDLFCSLMYQRNNL